MAFGFVKKTWKDRISEYPTRRTLTKEDGSTELVTVSRSEGTVSQEGDAFSADNMNDLETRVDNALTEANSNLIQDLLYNSEWTAPSIYESRVKILDGGYFIKDGYCYINLRFQAVTTLTGGSTYTVFANLPKPTKLYPLICATYGSSNEDLWLPATCAITTAGSLKFKSNESFSTGCFSVVGFYKIA